MRTQIWNQNGCIVVYIGVGGNRLRSGRPFKGMRTLLDFWRHGVRIWCGTQARWTETQPAAIPDRNPKCATNGSKSLSLYSSGTSSSMQRVAMMVSMVFLTVTPCARNKR